MAHPSRPKRVDLMKLGASLAHAFRSAENSSSGMASGMAAEAMAVCTECISSVSGMMPVRPRVQPMM